MAGPAVTVSEFRIGSVLGRGFSILIRNIIPFGLLSLLVMSPTYIYALAVDPQIYLEKSVYSMALFGLGLTGSIESFLTYFVTAALVYGTFQKLRGRHASLRDCVSRGLAMMLAVFGAATLAGLATGLATLALVIPGLVVWTVLWVAIPTAVVERPGVIASLGRSVELTKGYRWQVFSTIVIITVIAFVATLVTVVAFSFLAGTVLNPTAIPTAIVLGDWFVTAFFSALLAVVSAVSYHDLRVVKEGVDIEQSAMNFD